MKVIRLIFLGLVALLVIGCTLLPYNNVKYDAKFGWTATSEKLEFTQFNSASVYLGKGGIGTVLEMDTFRTSTGIPFSEYSILATIPAEKFAATSTEGYIICATHLGNNQKWCVDLSTCGEIFLTYDPPRGVIVRAYTGCEGITRP